MRSKKAFGKVGILGHSEGGAIAFMLGAQRKTDFIVSLAGPGVKLDTLLAAQSNRMLALMGQLPIMTVDKYRQQTAVKQNPYLQWLIDYDPSADIRSTRCPVFALNGDRDCQVISSQNLPAIRQLISIPAGLAKMNLGSFILFTCLGAAIWNGILVLIGHICHTQIDKATLIGTISHYSHIIGIGAIILVIGIIGFLIYQGLKPVKKADSTTDSDKE